MIILIDFDGTIVESNYPQIGKALPKAFEVMAELIRAGHTLILWTCRENMGRNINRQYLADAVIFCKENGVEFDAVNETIEELDFRAGEDCLMRKPNVDIILDDSNFGGFPGWQIIREYFYKRPSPPIAPEPSSCPQTPMGDENPTQAAPQSIQYPRGSTEIGID